MTKPKSKRLHRQMPIFILVGGFAALVNWTSRLVLSQNGIPLGVAVVMAYVIGMVTAYVLSRRFVFDSSGRSVANEIVRFTIVNLVALLQVWLVTMGLEYWAFPAIGWTWHSASLAHAIGVASPIVTSYLGHRYFTFGRQKVAPGTTEPTPKP
jgi:putative flippase GtrA